MPPRLGLGVSRRVHLVHQRVRRVLHRHGLGPVLLRQQHSAHRCFRLGRVHEARAHGVDMLHQAEILALHQLASDFALVGMQLLLLHGLRVLGAVLSLVVRGSEEDVLAARVTAAIGRRLVVEAAPAGCPLREGGRHIVLH